MDREEPLPDTIYIGLGANIGKKKEAIREAVRLISDLNDTSCRAIASLWETSPVGHKDQPAFLNTALSIESTLPLHLLHAHLIKIEKRLGKETLFINGPRSIDIDILHSKREKISSASLQVPHPRMWERLFVLLPLQEIAVQEDFQYDFQFAHISDKIAQLQSSSGTSEHQHARIFLDKESRWWE